LNQVANTVVNLKSMIKTMSAEINDKLKILGLCSDIHLKAFANFYVNNVLGKLEAYESCDISKAKQKKTNKL
jgi:hypothetical protein